MTKLKLWSVAVAVALTSSAAMAAGEAKNVIFFLGDGYGPVTYTAARIYMVKEEGSLITDTMPYTARVKTYSLDAQTTDSAPSMAAYTTGVKTRNDVIGMNAATLAIPYKPSAVMVANNNPADGGMTSVNNAKNNCPASGNGAASANVIEMAKLKNKATGVVTTARLTHATPAATYAHVCHRDAEFDISAQAVPGGAGYNGLLGTGGIDVLMGGARSYWTPFDNTSNKTGRPDGRNLTTEMVAKGYTYATDRASMMSAPTAAGSKILGLFSPTSHMTYELDRNPATEPSLADMTAKAIDVLSKNSNGYYLMVEGGRIDHALHDTNAKRALEEAKAFDAAIRVALSKVDLSNTLIVVTADHDHTMAFNGYGKRGSDILGNNINYADGQPSLDADGNAYPTLVFGNGANRPDLRSSSSNGIVTGNDYLQEVAIRLGGKGSETHGGGDVMLFSIGAGSKTFKGTIDNTKVFSLIKDAAGY